MIYKDTQTWPPFPATVAGPLREWGNWLDGRVGDAEALPMLENRPGVLGRVERLFYRQDTTHRERNALHLPLAQDVATASADLLFGEELQITWPDERTGDRMAEVLNGCGFYSVLHEAGELSAGLGGAYLRVCWDADVVDHPLVTAHGQDSVIPTFRYGRLVEATVWEIVEDENNAVWRHLEIHRRGEIEHELRKGTPDRLGASLDLDAHPATRGLPTIVKTGYDGLLVSYLPNVKPHTPWRRDPLGRNLGRADFGAPGTLGFMAAVDDTWSSWMRDIRLGRGRLLVSSTMLETLGNGFGASFDLDREVFEAVNFMQPENATLEGMISAQQLAIRAADHAATIDALVRATVRACGYSGSTFGLDGGDAAKTATEINSVDRRSAATREKKSRYGTAAVTDTLTAMAVIDELVFGSGANPEGLGVAFPAAAQPDPLVLAQTISALRTAEVMSIETGVRTAQPDLDDAGVAAEVARILDERASTPTVDPFGLSGTGDTQEEGSDDGAAEGPVAPTAE